jgi:hypothetical protein
MHNSQPQFRTLNPQLGTQNSQPETQNPKLRTRNSELATRNSKLFQLKELLKKSNKRLRVEKKPNLCNIFRGYFRFFGI